MVLILLLLCQTGIAQAEDGPTVYPPEIYQGEKIDGGGVLTKWWFWTIAAIVAGGVVVVAGSSGGGGGGGGSTTGSVGVTW